MKNKIGRFLADPFGLRFLNVILLVIVCAFFASGCGMISNDQAIGAGEQGGGFLYASTKLAKVDPSPAGTVAQQTAVADLQRVSSDIKAFEAGTLTQTELGYVNAKLKADGVAISGNTAAVQDLTGIANIFAETVSNPNGSVGPLQQLAQGTVTNVLNGISKAIQQQEGAWSLTNPGAWPVPPAPTSALWRASSPRAAIFPYQVIAGR